MIPALQLVNTILDRARDPQGIATSQQICFSLASTAQQVVNGSTGDVIVSNPLYVQPRTPIYQLSAFFTDLVDVKTVQDTSGRDLSPIEGGADELAAISYTWIADIGQPRAWAKIGKDLLVIYPSPPISSIQVNVFYTRLIPVMGSLVSDTTTVPNETDYAVMTLTEILLLLKARDYRSIPEAIKRYQGQITELRGEER